jgi:hypothetical protein
MKIHGDLHDLQKLETIEIDVKNKVFKVNGEDFGERCLSFDIHCDAYEWDIRLEMTKEIIFGNYGMNGEEKKPLIRKETATMMSEKMVEAATCPLSVEYKERILNEKSKSI